MTRDDLKELEDTLRRERRERDRRAVMRQIEKDRRRKVDEGLRALMERQNAT